MAIKKEMFVCNVNVNNIVFDHKVRNEAGDFVVKDSYTFECDAVPDQLENGDSFASMKAYGIRAFLSDRTSQLREFGVPAVVAGMQEVYNDLLCAGLYRAKKAAKAGSVNQLLVLAVAELKGVDTNVAAASIKKLAADQLEKLMANEQIKELMSQAAKDRANSEAVDLDDLMAEGDKK